MTQYGQYGAGYNQSYSGAQGYTDHDSDEIDLARVWDILVDHRWWLVAFTLAALVLGGLYISAATPIYQASALLQVEKDQKTLPGLSEMSDMFSQESEAQTEIQLIRSRMVLGQAVDNLDLDIRVHPERGFFGDLLSEPYQPGLGEAPGFGSWRDGEARVTLSELELPERLRGEALTLTAREDKRYQLTREGRTLLQGRPGKSVSENGVTIRVDTLNIEPGRTFTVTQVPRLAITRSLNNRLSASERGEDSGILSLSFTHPSPPRASAILGAIAQAYRQQNLERRSAEAEQSIEFLEKQIPDVKEDLTQAEDKLNEYRSKSDSVNMEKETESKLKRLVELETRLNELSVKEKQLQQRYTKEHPAYKTLLDQRASIQQEKAQLEEQIENLPGTQQEILRLRRDMDVNQQIYMQLRNRAQEMRVLKAGTVANVRIIDGALTSPEPVKPRKPLILALSLVLGAMAGLAFVLLRSFFNRTLQSPEELEGVGLNVYASIPISEKQQAMDREHGEQRTAERPPLLALEAPSDVTLEALRSLRTSLHFAMMDAYSNVLVLTGPTPGVGKSFISANMGAIMAQAGQRIALVDADLRRGHMHRHLGVASSPGLSDYLAGNAALAEIRKKTVHDQLHFIPRGHVPPDPAELLMHKRMQELVDELANNYDMVIMDTPPILAVTDPAIVGQHAGACMMVVRYGLNPLKEVEVAHKRFEQNGLKVRGTILNGLRYSRANTYGYYPYRYGADKGGNES